MSVLAKLFGEGELFGKTPEVEVIIDVPYSDKIVFFDHAVAKNDSLTLTCKIQIT